MKTTITILALLLAINSYSQDIEIGYFPAQKENVTDSDYNRGIKALEHVYNDLKEDSIVSFGDYWNTAMGLSFLKEKPEKIYRLLVSAKKNNPDSFCYLVDASKGISSGSDIRKHSLYKTLGTKFIELIESCKGYEIKPVSLEDRIAEKENKDLIGLNEVLIDRLLVLIDKDQRYRGASSKTFKENVELIKKLDTEVEIEVIKIFEKYGYAGKDIVGYYQDYLCLLLEHTCKLSTIEKYFPLVAKAFKNNQLKKGPFKMLIDRMYFFRNGEQIFGSHSGVPYADDKVIAEVKKKYGLLESNSNKTINVGSKKITITDN